MDLGASGLTAALIALVIVLVRIVEHLVFKKKNGAACNGLNPTQTEQLDHVFSFCKELKIEWDYMKRDVRSVKEDQDVLYARIADLISSQQRVTDRINDLIISVDKLITRQ